MAHSNSNTVRVRFAPSPTGYLHVGGARSALYNYLFAKKNGGVFILRIEDTDLERSTETSLRMLMEDLQWLGLNWDEGPDPKTLGDRGTLGPYRQSQRIHIYHKYAELLWQNNYAYYCFLTDEELEQQRQERLARGEPPHVDSPYRYLSPQEALALKRQGKPATLRFRTEHLRKEYVFEDLVRGRVTFPSDMVGDFVLVRSDGMPVYNF
ncbi:MAG: glutamate--tRNA ligase family protein, partial [Bdellovibrionaceae bacterium]|nr:glutamate--tRNA ligase family protein [Pseudobdellovibrionaceae bacterium]MDW8190536.1 glutamate--tRNA ligase family protein [Pseudobdellovibrionaceae bacterium]